VSLLDELIPEYGFSERHSTFVAASPADALAAVKAATPREMAVTRILFMLRSLPALLRSGHGLPADPSRPLADQMVEFGFVPLVDDERGLAVGFVGQPWRVAGGSMPRLASAGEWHAFGEPGYVKAAMSFTAVPEGKGARVETETRILATDPASGRKFGRYWRLIRPGSGLIRRSWLRAAKRRGEDRR
jgi:hypothetical protein